MARKPKKYHYIYKTTCKITGKFYVGMHSSDTLDDGYLGSGKILGYSRKKYGDENHLREILEFCSSRDELKQREKEIVCETLLADPLNINLKYGGDGGWEFVNSTGANIRNDFLRDDEYRRKISLARTGIKPKLTEAGLKKLTEGNAMKRPEVADKVKKKLTGQKKSGEHKKRISEKIKQWHKQRKAAMVFNG